MEEREKEGERAEGEQGQEAGWRRESEKQERETDKRGKVAKKMERGGNTVVWRRGTGLENRQRKEMRQDVMTASMCRVVHMMKDMSHCVKMMCACVRYVNIVISACS